MIIIYLTIIIKITNLAIAYCILGSGKSVVFERRSDTDSSCGLVYIKECLGRVQANTFILHLTLNIGINS